VISQIAVSRLHGRLYLVTVTGEHDLSTVPQLEQALAQIEPDHSNVVIDLAATQFIDSSILGVLVRRAAVPGGKLVAAPGSPPRRVLDLVALQSVLAVYDSRSDALAALSAEPFPSRSPRVFLDGADGVLP